MSLADEIYYGTLDAVKRELDQNDHVNFIDEYGHTPLIDACIVNDIEKIKLILEHGAEINKEDLVGGTPLHWAAENSNLDACKLLLEKGANPNSYTASSQPILAKALLRDQTDLKKLLVEHGASTTFAYDFINTKLLGHRFELTSSVDIVDTEGYFTEVDFEGFYLEFTMDLITYSLRNFINNFAARHLREHFPLLQKIIATLDRCTKLVEFQHYQIDFDKHLDKINPLLDNDPLIIPVTQEGHALTLIKHRNLICICDRMVREKKIDKLIIYQMTKPYRFTHDLLTHLVYEVQPLEIYHDILPKELGLKPMTDMTIPSQITGNCTWANVEASVPLLYMMITLNEKTGSVMSIDKQTPLHVFSEWRKWDQERALQFYLQGFAKADKKRKASIASTLAAILFQCCSADDKDDVERAMKIMPILRTEGHEYILKNYIKVYCDDQQTEAGKNLKRLIKRYEDYHLF